MHLTQRIIDKAEWQQPASQSLQGGQRVVLWDDQLRGFGVRIYPGGTKSFVLSYRSDCKKRLMVLGRVGVLTLTQARRLATKRLAEIVGGEDPLQERTERRQAVTVAEVGARYLEEHARAKKKPRSVITDEILLRRHILPRIGTLPLVDINRGHISALHHDMRQTRIQANRALALLSKMFNLAERWGLRPDGSNPCRHIDRFKENARQRYLSPEELSRLGSAIEEAEQSQSEHPSALLAIRLILLTGCRKSEILELRWNEVDLDRGLLLLADSKTGAKVVPLGGNTVSLLKAAAEDRSSDFVCVGLHGNGPFSGLHRPWARLRKAADLEGVRLHDLRHTFAAIAASNGFSLRQIGGVLGHKSAQTTQRYAHLYQDSLRELATKVADAVTRTLGTKTTRG